jgi:hypothetical protein
MYIRSALCLCLLAAGVPAHAVKASALVGTWEAARTVDDERTYVRLMEKGKAEIVAEYDFELPGQPGKRRGRSTTFAKWSVKGDDVTISYAKVNDRLRYSAQHALTEIGLEGTSAGLKPMGTRDPKSRIRAILWKTPHDYRLKAPAETSGSTAAPAGGQAR